MAPNRFVYDFDEPSDGGRELLGGKGIGLAEMTQLGVPVPAGFTITTDACRAYMAAGGELPEGLDAEVDQHLAALEEKTGKRFGDPADPLLVSVRSGAAVSMPGMMDTILNLGLNDEAVRGLAERTGNARFANDSYRRLIQMYGEVVDGIAGHLFEDALAKLKDERGAAQDVDLSADDLGAARRDLQGDLRDARPAARSRRTRASSSHGPCARSSSPGTPRAPRSTGARTTFRTTSGPRSTSSRWSSGTRARARRRAWRSRATLRPAKPGSTGSSSPMRRARTSSRESARPSRSSGCSRALPDAFEQFTRHDAPARGALPRHAGHRVHGRGRAALPAPDQNREEDGRGGAQVRRGHGRRGPHLPRGRRRAHRPRPARPAAAPDDRPDRGASRSWRRA